jgi:hypothetical protein
LNLVKFDVSSTQGLFAFQLAENTFSQLTKKSKQYKKQDHKKNKKHFFLMTTKAQKNLNC